MILLYKSLLLLLYYYYYCYTTPCEISKQSLVPPGSWTDNGNIILYDTACYTVSHVRLHCYSYELIMLWYSTRLYYYCTHHDACVAFIQDVSLKRWSLYISLWCLLTLRDNRISVAPHLRVFFSNSYIDETNNGVHNMINILDNFWIYWNKK